MRIPRIAAVRRWGDDVAAYPTPVELRPNASTARAIGVADQRRRGAEIGVDAARWGMNGGRLEPQWKAEIFKRIEAGRRGFDIHVEHHEGFTGRQSDERARPSLPPRADRRFVRGGDFRPSLDERLILAQRREHTPAAGGVVQRVGERRHLPLPNFIGLAG